jgi:hypothetical protein
VGNSSSDDRLQTGPSDVGLISGDHVFGYARLEVFMIGNVVGINLPLVIGLLALVGHKYGGQIRVCEGGFSLLALFGS